MSRNIRVRRLRAAAPFSMKIAVAADLHGAPAEPILAALEGERPDIILLAGDVLEGPVEGRELLRKGPHWSIKYQRGLAFLQGVGAIAPTFYTAGNHENLLSPDCIEQVRAAGVTPLINESTVFGRLHLGGLASPHAFGREDVRPDQEFLARFAAEQGHKILICHQPEYFDRYIASTDIALTVSGHAHGGQWRLFGRGVFSPGQGFFPKYTAGLYHERLAVTTGLCNHVRFIPRIFNPIEIMSIQLEKKI